ncbi:MULTISPECIES: hypothetical protein [Vibrio]|uniref:Uncharacterized protein n=1 Tax=Vibrio spartinae TaxID=1918945 RepID=A0A1N6M9Q3_9VIBR|nr:MULTISPECIES: hypothetical protein [Vibrio]KUI98933.1 hypothetical protein VRK_19340 [Vibrio sp. MEBiC08052]SIO96087.1 hypothetical protein VSP9026_03847 [Vibrio spartinae]
MNRRIEEVEMIRSEADLAILALEAQTLNGIPGIATLQQKMMAIRDAAHNLNEWLTSEIKKH